MLLAPRQRATSLCKSRHLVPKRHVLGPKITPTIGADHTVTLTGPSAKASVSFPLESEKRYRIYCSVTTCTVGVHTTAPLFDEQFLGEAATFSYDANQDLMAAGQHTDLQPYGYNLIGVRGSSFKFENSAEAPAEFSITYGNFYAREIKS